MTTNRYGLSRHIPDDVKWTVRQAAGFGCVCCGVAFCHYEHIDPEYRDAKSHDPSQIAYLCGGCHDRVTRGVWSKAKVAQARLAPWAIARGKCHDAFDIGYKDVAIWVCGQKVVNVRHILLIDGVTLLSIEPPEAPGAPYRVSGSFYAPDGRLLFQIDRNEWIGDAGSWDIECIGPRVFVRTGPDQIALQLCAVSPRGLVIERLDLRYNGVRVYGTVQDGLSVETPDKTSSFGFGGLFLITGLGNNSIVINVNNGHAIIGGPVGTGLTLGPNPEPHPWRRPATLSSPCPCGRAIAFRKCCGAKT